MKILFLHGWHGVVGGGKATFLKEAIRSVANPEQLVANSGLPPETLIEVGNDHRLADPLPLQSMLEACERLTTKVRT